MAGGIVLPSEEYWSAAGWAYRAVLRAVVDELADHGATKGLAIELDDETGPSQVLGFVDTTEWPIEKAEQLLRSVRPAFTRCKANGPEDWTDPSFFPGFLNRFSELADLADDWLSKST